MRTHSFRPIPLTQESVHYFSSFQSLSAGEPHGALTPVMTHNVSAYPFSAPPLSSVGVVASFVPSLTASHGYFNFLSDHYFMCGLSGPLPHCTHIALQMEAGSPQGRP